MYTYSRQGWFVHFLSVKYDGEVCEQQGHDMEGVLKTALLLKNVTKTYKKNHAVLTVQ